MEKNHTHHCDCSHDHCRDEACCNTSSSEKNESGCGCSHQHGSSEIKKDSIRLGIGLILMIAGILTEDVQFVVSLTLFIAAYLIAGGEVLLSAVQNLFHLRPLDESFLMTLATVGAFAMGQYAEGVAVMLFYGFGEMMQGLAVSKSKKSIANLMDLRPDFARRSGSDITCDPSDISVGDSIDIYPGEKIPLDGTVLSGTSYLDTSALTGESMPRSVGVGDSVLSGSVNGGGKLTVCVTSPFAQSTASKILSLMEEAADKKSPSEQFITKFARIYTPVVVAMAVAVAFLPPLILGFSTFPQYLYAALSFLIISCPCALVVSIPVSFFAGLGCASKQGILIKGGNYLDALAAVDAAIFDKTGTLTKGKFHIERSFPAEDVSAEDLLLTAAVAEQTSSHPIALSILDAAGSMNIPKSEDVFDKAGYGISCTCNGEEILVGKAALLTEAGILVDEIPSTPYTTVFVAKNKKYMGALTVADGIKETAKDSIKKLQSMGISCHMLTGDRKEVAAHVSQVLGLNSFKSQLLPGDKVEAFEALMSTSGKTVFLGDGINDAPVLSRADIGIAMGGVGSDAAIEAADVVFMDDDIEKLPVAISISKKTRRLVKENIWFSLGAKGIIMVLAVLGISSLWLAVFADVGVALLCIANSMRALKN